MIHNDSQTSRERGGLTKLDVRALHFVRAFVVVGASWFAVTGLLPFQPYAIEGYRAIPSVGCSPQIIQLHLIRTATRPFLGWISRVDLDVRWQNVETGNTLVSLTPSNVFNGSYGRDEDAIGILSTAPDEPGTWRIITIATVSGFKLLMPNEQVTTHASDQVYTLLPDNSADCRIVPGG